MNGPDGEDCDGGFAEAGAWSDRVAGHDAGLRVDGAARCPARPRHHLFKYGYVFPQGITHVATLVALIEDPQSSLPESLRIILKLLVDTFTALEAQIATLDAQQLINAKIDEAARLLRLLETEPAIAV
jgi:hypothetical protein